MPSHSMVAVVPSSVIRNFASVNCSATQIAVLENFLSLAPDFKKEDSLGVKFKGPTNSYSRCSLCKCQKDDHLILEILVHASAFFQSSPELSSCFRPDISRINTFLSNRAPAQYASVRRRCPQNNSRSSADSVRSGFANHFDVDDGWVDSFPL